MWNQQDLSYKKLINKLTTSSNKKYYEEFGANTLDLNISDLKVDDIPYDNPTLGVANGVLQQETLHILQEDITVSGSQTWKSIYTDWISDKFGSSYIIRLFDSLNQEIFPTDLSQWYFDTVTGVLISNSQISANKPYKISGYRYIGNKGSDTIPTTNKDNTFDGIQQFNNDIKLTYLIGDSNKFIKINQTTKILEEILLIDDDSISLNSTWSSTKISDMIGAGGTSSIDNVVVGESVSINDVIYLSGDGKWYKTDYTNESSVSSINRIVKTSGISNDTVEAYRFGKITISGLTVGTSYYIGSDGSIISDADMPLIEGIFQKYIGTCTKTNEFDFYPDQNYVQLTLLDSNVVGGTGTNYASFVYNETPNGAVNGSNAIYMSNSNFIPETLKVYVNGIKQTLIDDYNTVGNNTLIFSYSPDINDVINIDYIKI
jgi:hypothetical protein